METNRTAKRKRTFLPKHTTAIAGAILLVSLIVWLMPRRVDRVVPADGTAAWNERNAPPRRQIVWKAPEEIRDLLPNDPPKTQLATPRLTDGGATLYLTRRDKSGQADIYRARLLDGKWQPAKPVAELNTAGDEIGPTLSRDGNELFLFSNRPGGQGGFDVYVSTRIKTGWSAPQNLGSQINSTADEYSPALSPGGKTLYFASNRSENTPNPKESTDSKSTWNATIRTRKGKQTFDLFTTQRDGEKWQTPEPIPRLNQKESSEGTPYPSPDGAFLYFASDRNSRQGEQRNLDLYRARIINGQIGSPENLGPSINTAAHETEPALSPEGFTLLFSSDRFDGQDLLFASSAQEVFVEQEWDSSHLPIIPSFWWWTLSISLLAALLLLFLTIRYREQMLEKVWPARFFLGSILVNLLLLFLLAVWKLDVIELIAKGLGEGNAPGTQGVRGMIDQSDSTDGDTRKAFERVDDLAPVQRADDNPKVNDALALNRVELSIPKANAKRSPLRPSKNVILLTPQNRRLEPVREPPKQKQPVNRLALSRREPLPLKPLDNLQFDEKRPPSERKIEQNIKLGRLLQMKRPSRLAVLPKSRMKPISAQPTVVELQKTEPTREPPISAKKSDLQTVRSVSQLASANPVLPNIVSTPNIAASEAPKEKSVEAPKNVIGKSVAASPKVPTLPVRTPVLRRVIKAVPVVESPLKIAKADPLAVKPKSLDEVFKPAQKKKQISAGKTASIADKKLATITPPAASMGPVKTANNNELLKKSPLPGVSPLKPAVKSTQSFNPRAKAVSFDQQSGYEPPRPNPQGRVVPPSPKRSRSPANGANALASVDADKKVELQASKSPKLTPPNSLAGIKDPLPKSSPGKIIPLAPLTRKIGKIELVPLTFNAKKKNRGRKQPRNTKPLGVKLASLKRTAARGDQFANVGERIDLRTMLILRSPENRMKNIEKLGGTKESEAAVNRGLKWLADHQNADGSWSLNRFHLNCKGKHPTCSGLGKEHSDTAATGITLLPFLAAGHTHQKGAYQKTVLAALNWIVAHQKPDGDLLVKGDGQHMYSHGIAAIALCESYGMSEDPKLKIPAQRAIDFIIKAQSKSLGGWRYTPRASSDTSVVGWQMMALKSGQMAGFTVPKSTFDNVRRWLKSVEGPRSGQGTFGYSARGSTPAMTAEGLLCLQFMEAPEDTARLQSGANYLLKHLPKQSSNLTSYYWYYATQVMYHMQGKYWDAWNDRMRGMLAKTQIKTGHLAGTWTPRDRWEQRGGRIYSTAMRVLILEVYYRHLPIFNDGGR